MKISAKGIYGVQTMVALARGCGENLQSVKCIAEAQGIPQAFLEQVISPLRKAELVISVRGAGGGYALAKEPKDITIGEILRELEGPLAAADCLITPCENAGICAMHRLWQMIFDGINGYLDSITLQDVLNLDGISCKKNG